jgi:SAM-dependent methyltransferase
MDQSGGYDEFGFVADFYDYIPYHRERNDVAFFLDAARKYGQPILELGCGTGRILIPLAREGFQITGLDLSEPMLARCREMLSKETMETRDNNVELIKGDMRNFRIDKEFNLVTVPFRAFQHLLTVEEQISCLSSIWRHLKPDGRLILDLFNPSLHLLTDENRLKESGDEPEFEMPDGRRVCRRQRFAKRNYFEQVNECELIYYVTYTDGSKERLVHSFPLRYLFRFEVEHLLARTGFSVEHLYGDYDKNHFGNSYPGEMIFVAQKSA